MRRQLEAWADPDRKAPPQANALIDSIEMYQKAVREKEPRTALFDLLSTAESERRREQAKRAPSSPFSAWPLWMTSIAFCRRSKIPIKPKYGRRLSSRCGTGSAMPSDAIRVSIVSSWIDRATPRSRPRRYCNCCIAVSPPMSRIPTSCSSLTCGIRGWPSANWLGRICRAWCPMTLPPPTIRPLRPTNAPKPTPLGRNSSPAAVCRRRRRKKDKLACWSLVSDASHKRRRLRRLCEASLTSLQGVDSWQHQSS